MEIEEITSFAQMSKYIEQFGRENLTEDQLVRLEARLDIIEELELEKATSGIQDPKAKAAVALMVRSFANSRAYGLSHATHERRTKIATDIQAALDEVRRKNAISYANAGKRRNF